MTRKSHQPLPPRLPVTVAEVTDVLLARLGLGVSDVAALGSGAWSSAYTFRYQGQGLVVRFSTLDEDFRKDRIAAGYRSAMLPVPGIIEFGALPGGYYAISERAYGFPLDSLSPSDLSAALPSVLATLDALRAVDVSAFTGYGLWDAAGHAQHHSWRHALLSCNEDRPPDNRLHGWPARLEAIPAAMSAFSEAYQRLAELTPYCPEARHLIHSDLTNGNVLVQHGAVTAVFDWGSACYGDFLYDLAWLEFSRWWIPAWSTVDIAGTAQRHYAVIELDVPHFQERLLCYQLHIGLESMAYNAFQGRMDNLIKVTEHTLRLARDNNPASAH